jgi:O-acetyl-ADP-ribose deacetylase (regulator of RNase III)
MIKIVEGNILNAIEDVRCQQVNCQGVMGAGLALQVKNKYLEVYNEYIKTCKQTSPQKLLGSVQYIECHDGYIFANLFGQLNYGKGQQYTLYSALKNCLEYVHDRAKKYEETVAIPYGIGCGLAGGDWEIVYKMIESIFSDYEVTIYKLV